MTTSRFKNGRQGPRETVGLASTHSSIFAVPTSSTDVLSGYTGNERDVLAMALEFGTLVEPEPEPRDRFGARGWYGEHCEKVSRAVWHGQLTEAEATFDLEFWHAVLMLEMERENLWRKPRRGNGRRFRRRFVRRFRGRRCDDCGELVGPFTGVCVCRFDGWWTLGEAHVEGGSEERRDVVDTRPPCERCGERPGVRDALCGWCWLSAWKAGEVEDGWS